MVELKREYVIPLRRKTNLAPKWRRSKKAVSVLNDFVKKHMKTDEVIICSELNEKIWENGIKNPPGKVSVIALKTKINGTEKVIVNLLDVGIENHMKKYVIEQPVVENKTVKKVEKTKIKEAEVKEIKETQDIEVKKEKIVEVENKEKITSKKESTKKEIKK